MHKHLLAHINCNLIFVGPCEFGAEQAILVATEAAKKKLVARVGNRALVFTVLECKGLEFQVLIGSLVSWQRIRSKFTSE